MELKKNTTNPAPQKPKEMPAESIVINSSESEIPESIKKEQSPTTVTANDNVVPISDRIYFIEDDTEQVLNNLKALKSQIYPISDSFPQEPLNQAQFPSVCFVGLGRCGSNISLYLANLVYSARNFYLNDFKKSEKSSKMSSTTWIKRALGKNTTRNKRPHF